VNGEAAELQFAVIHLGARLHYAAPTVLEQAGMLNVLYTDSHANSGPLAPLRALPAGVRPRGLKRLLARRIPTAIPARKVRSWVRPSLQIEWLYRAQPQRRKQARYWHQRQLGGHWLAQRAIAENFGDANALYVHACASTDAVHEAKRRGMFIVLEAISHPLNKFIERDEFERFGMEAPEPLEELTENLDFFREEAELADVILAASPYVRDGLVELGLDASRIFVVPYGLEVRFFDEPPKPEPGRVLFVGNVGCLKGVPYLAEATRRLQADGVNVDVRVVGPHDGHLIRRPEFAGPRYVGQMPRAAVKDEFLRADVFVFPTLSDGFGIVQLEAMAAGLPVVSTPHCAALVEEGKNGFVVPPRDAAALAQRVRELCTDRALRGQLSAGAVKTAGRHTLTEYQETLLRAITTGRRTTTGSRRP
jgi:glycosyltransferase involved in cell wall biosynthesis